MKYVLTFIITVLMGAIFLYSSTRVSAELPPDCGTSCTTFEDIYDTYTCPFTLTAPLPNETQCGLSQKCIITTILNGECQWPLAYEGYIDTYRQGSCVQDSACKTSYSGTIYADTNRNGSIDAGDEKKSGVTVKLEEGPYYAPGVENPTEQWYETSNAVTGVNGTYRFDDVIPRENYRLNLMIPDGYSAITTNPIDAPSRGGVVDFPLAPPPTTIYYNLYGPAISGVKEINSCYFSTPPSPLPCGETFFDDNCTFKPECSGHHCTNSQTGYDCAIQKIGDPQATCLNTNYVYPNGPDYSSICTGNSYYGFQFYIPPQTPACAVDSDCLSDGNECTQEKCSGGACIAPTNLPAGTVCTNGACNGAGVCTPASSSVPAACQVTTAPASQTITMGESRIVTASVTGLPAGRTISQMLFGAYENPSGTIIASVNPTSNSTPYLEASTYYYYTAVTAVAVGNTAVWATAKLDNGDTTACQAAGNADTDINVVTPILTSTPTPTPTPTPVSPDQFYSISGKIFDDANGNAESAGDNNYTDNVLITVVKNSTGVSYPVTKSGGNYTAGNLPAGEYTIKFSGLPTGYRFTYPTTPENSLIVEVGLSCSVPGTSEASCP